MARIGLLLPLAWRNLWRNRRRTLITLLVVAVGVWSILAFSSLLQAWARSSRDASLKLLTGDGQIHARGYRTDPDIAHSFGEPGQALRRVLNSGPVSAWAGRVRVTAIIQSEFRTLPVSLLGIDPASEKGLSFIPQAVSRGHYLQGLDGNGVLIGQHLADRLGTGLGKRVVLMAQARDGRLAQAGFRIVGVYRAPQQVEGRAVFIGLARARKLLGAAGRLSEIAFRVKREERLSGVIQRLRAAAPQLDIQPWYVLKPLTRAVANLSEGFVGIWLWVMFVLMALGIVNTQLMSVFERVREFGLLQALGLRPGDIMLEVLIESALLVGLGVVIGAGAAVATVASLSDGISLGFLARGAEWLGAQHVLYPRINAGEYLLFAAVIWVLGVLAALWPSWRASRFNPREAMAAT